MRDLNFSIKQVCDRNRDGGYAAISNRSRMLSQIATQVHQLGFRDAKQAHDLKPKHIHLLVNKWQMDGISVGTIKNRMSCLRWLSEKISKPDLVKPTNEAYGIENRVYVTNEDKSVRFEQDKIDAISSAHIQASALLQREFGLRRSEAMKFQPNYADRETSIVLKASWCKGGRAREIPIITEAQRAAVDRAHEVAGKSSLIPRNTMYSTHFRAFEKMMEKVGLSRTHGARHAYAQHRYRELTGRDCPAKGGKVSKELTREEKAIDYSVRKTISIELGHEREGITATYLGR